MNLSGGALLAVTLRAADEGGVTTTCKILAEAQQAAQSLGGWGVEEPVAGMGHHGHSGVSRCKSVNR